ncbi:MAG: hypothetical protein QM644_19285 [Mobilitalea sp.]
MRATQAQVAGIITQILSILCLIVAINCFGTMTFIFLVLGLAIFLISIGISFFNWRYAYCNKILPNDPSIEI